jgi:hypothetical protein
MKVEYPSNYPPENKPIGAWAYFGLDLLYSIPLVGLICAIIFALKNRNNHMRSFARAVIFKRLIIAVIFILLFLLLLFLKPASNTVYYY